MREVSREAVVRRMRRGSGHRLSFLGVTVALLLGAGVQLAGIGTAGATTPPSFTWSGAGSASTWSTGTNWTSAAPTGTVGTLTFPDLTSTGCDASTPPAGKSCYTTVDNVTGLSTVGLVFTAPKGSYTIGGTDTLTVGTGGITVTPPASTISFEDLSLPLTLSAPQTWSITGPAELSSAGGITGSSSLTVDLQPLSSTSSGTTLALTGTNEVGAFTATGPALASHTPPSQNGTLLLNGAGGTVGDLNGTNGHSVHLTNVALSGAGPSGTPAKVGALATTHAEVQVLQTGSPGVLSATSATFDATSVLQMEIKGSPSSSSELTSTGTVTLGTVELTAYVTGTCPSAGTSYTLVSAGTVSGQVSAQSSTGAGTVPVATGGFVSLGGCTDLALKIHHTSTELTGTVVRATTTTVTAPSGGASVDFGTSETYTATVVPATGAGTPAGTVTFSAAPTGPSGPGLSTTLCTATLSAVSGTQTATCSTTNAPAGSDTITAAYSPASTTTTFAGSSGSGFETVHYTTSATVTVNGAASGSGPAGGLVTYHVVVSNTSTGVTADPTGSVMVQTAPGSGSGSFPVPVCTAALFPTGTGTSAASCTASDAPAGTDQVTATYPGGTDFAGSRSAAATLDATGVATTFMVFSTSAGTTAVHADQSITYSATVLAAASGSTSAPSGTVAVFGGFTATLPLCTITLVPGSGTTASGTCTSTVVPMLPDSTVPVTGVYSGDTTYAGSAGETHLTMPTPSTAVATSGLQISVSPSATTSGTTVTYGVTVSSNDPGAPSPPTPTGTVTFASGSTILCTVTSLSSPGAGSPATGSCTSPAAPAGEDTVTAVYSGDTTYGGSAAVAPLTVTGTSTSTTVTVDSKTSATVGDGASVSYAATVLSTGTTPTGTVTFLVGSATLCTATLSGGAGGCTSTAAPKGSDTVTARYSGGGANEPSSGTASLFVTGTEASTTSVTVTGKPSAAVASGTTVTYAATVSGAGATPTGTVTFSVGTTTLCIATLSSGHGTCTATNAPAGDDTVTGSYAGDATYAPSSGRASLSVTGTATSTTTVSITPSAGPYTYGEHIAYTATVRGASGTPTGTVTFSVGAATLCTGVALSAASATCTTTASPVGTTETVTASYSGDATYAPGRGSTTITVSKASTTTTMTASTTTPVVGQQVTYEAIVKAPAGSSRAPTGTVAFEDGGTVVSGCTAQHLGATGAATASAATCTVSYAATGQHSITASYQGSTDFGASASSPAVAVTVGTSSPPPSRPASTPTTTPPPAPSTSKDVSTGSSSTSTGSTGTVESTNPTTGVTATVNATGEGAVTVSQLTSTPKPPPSTLTVGSLIDVQVSSGSSFSKLTEKVCGPKVGTAIKWYDTATGTWETLKPTSGPTLSAGTPPCASFSLSSSSSPTISQLTGTAFAVGSEAVTRVFGPTADATAAAELTRAFPFTKGVCPASRAAVVATTKTYQDALSSQYLAQSLTSGTLLTPTEHLSSVTASALKNEGITTVYVVGGPLAVGTTVVKAIEALTAYGCGGTSPSGKITVHRLYGQTAYGTAEAVAEHVGSAPTKSFPGAYGTTNAAGGTGKYNDTAGKGSRAPAGSVPTAILASGEEFQDGQAASVIAYRTKLPLLLTPATTLSPTAVSAIEKLGIKQVILMGGPLAVTNTVEAALVAKTGVSVVRVAGKDYTDTASELARFEVAGTTAGLGWTPGHRVMVARGNGFTDGLAGAVLDSPHNTATGTSSSARPLLLTESPTVVGTYLTTFLKVTGHAGIDASSAKTITGLTVLGGTLAVSTAVVTQMQTALGH